MESVRNKWDRIYSQADVAEYSAVSVLTENAFLLPEFGTALDLACGLGANAIFLARHGLATEAWDISGVAIEKLQRNADSRNLLISSQAVEIKRHSLLSCCFDVIVLSRFLDRGLSNAIMGALKPGGLLFYQTYTEEKTRQKGPNNPDYLLAENELLRLFSGLRVIFYRENGCIGDIDEGLRNEVQFIGQKSR